MIQLSGKMRLMSSPTEQEHAGQGEDGHQQSAARRWCSM